MNEPRQHRAGDPVPPVLESALEARLLGVASRMRRYVLATGLVYVVGALFAGGCLQLLLDYGSRGLRWDMRCVLLLVVVGVASRQAWRRLIKPSIKRISIADVAAMIERRFPELGSVLISAVRFAAGEVGASRSNSPDLMASVVRGASSRVTALDFDAILDARAARRSVVGVCAVLAVVAASFLIQPQIMRLWFVRNVLLQDEPWPKQTYLVVDADDRALFGARGDDIIIHARADGVSPRTVDIFFMTEDGQRGRETMVTVGRLGNQTFRHTFRRAQQSLTFHLEGGDDVTETYEVRLVDRPAIVKTQMRLEPPAYARLDTIVLGDGQRAADFLPGTVVTINATTNKPVVTATLMADHDEVAKVEPFADTFVVEFIPEASTTYHFSLVDEVGLSNRRPTRLALRMIQDDPPHVRLKILGVGEMVTPDAVLAIEIDVSDTYGLAVVEITHERGGEEPSQGTIALPRFKPGSDHFAESLAWPVRAARANPGERLVLAASATDYDTVSGPNVGQSSRTALRVVTKEELLAELARREREFRMDFERLVEGQELVRGALLTVLRQHRQGTSWDDLAGTLATLERRQRGIASSVNVVRRQFEKILAELRTNQLNTTDEEKRLGEGVIPRLERLSKRDLPAAADSVRIWARSSAGESGRDVDPLQIEALKTMRAILRTMLQWEGYQEMVTMLRDMIRLQGELREETRESLQDESGDVFED